MLPGAARATQSSGQTALDAVISRFPADGTIIVDQDGKRLSDTSVLLFCTNCAVSPVTEASYRWASITKQITAVLVMQEVERGRIDLDAPLARYLPDFASPNAATVTVRQLLRHQSGLPNPGDTPPGEAGMPAYFLSGYRGNRNPLTGYCAGPVKGPPGGGWAYNNCDYIVAGALLERVTGQRFESLIKRRIAKPLKLKSLRFGGTVRSLRRDRQIFGPAGEPDIDFDAYGASGGLHGTPADLIAFDRALMDGKLLSEASLAVLWQGDPALGFMALGQWAYEIPLSGCAAPVRIIERRGFIGKAQSRNFIVPDRKIAAVAFTGDDRFDFGEIWQGKGFAHDLLAAAICEEKKP